MADKSKMSRRDLLTFWRKKEAPAAPAQPAASAHATYSAPTLEDPWPKERIPGVMFGKRLPLRPPGTMQEYIMRDACTRCGKCVEVCPADALYPLGEEWDNGKGTPALDPRKQPCVLCEGFQCTQVCPSGAIQPLFSYAEIKMGTARVDESRCLTYHGKECRACVEACPVPNAIHIEPPGDDHVGHPYVDPYTCVGCGLCVRACPTTETSIDVVPRD